MSGVGWRATTPEIATGTAVRTMWQILAAANHRVYVDKIDVSFKGIVVTDAPIFVRVLRQTTAGTGGDVMTPTKSSGDSETLLLTGLSLIDSSEPTAGDVLDSGEVHPQTARRFGPYWVPGGTRLGVEVTAGASTTCIVSGSGEE